MKAKRRKLTAEFKAQVALEALKGMETVSQIGARYEVHPNLVSKWKAALLNGASTIFTSVIDKSEKESDKEIEKLERKVGQLTMEVEFLEKKSVMLGLIPGRKSK